MSTKNILLYITFLIIFFISCQPITQNDVFWHLSVGRYIYENKTIPDKDIFSFTLYGTPWIDFEWLFHIIIYIVYKLSGFIGLIFFRAIIVVLTFFFLYKTLSLYGLPPYISSLGILFCLFLARPRIEVRPDIFTYFFLCVCIYFLQKGRQKNKVYYFIALLFIPWVNLHAGGNIFGLAIIFCYIAGGILNLLFYFERPFLPSAKEQLHFTKHCILAYTLLFLLCFLSFFINPYCYKIFHVLFQHLQGLLQGHILRICEWRPTPFGINFLGFWILAGVVLLLAVAKFFNEHDFIDLLITVSFIVAAITVTRNVPLLGFICIPIVLHRLWLVKIHLSTSAKALIYIFIVILCPYSFIYYFHPKVSWEYFPVGSCDFIEKNNLSGNVYNIYIHGAYFIWHFYPQRKNFMDSRYIFLSLVEEEQAAQEDISAWQRFIDKYQINYTLIAYPRTYMPMTYVDKYGKKHTIERALASIYFPKSSWALVYWDSSGIVYVRRNNLNKKVINKFEYKYVDPADIKYLEFLLRHKLIDRTKVIEELNRNQSECGLHPVLHDLLNKVLYTG